MNDKPDAVLGKTSPPLSLIPDVLVSPGTSLSGIRTMFSSLAKPLNVRRGGWLAALFQITEHALGA